MASKRPGGLAVGLALVAGAALLAYYTHRLYEEDLRPWVRVEVVFTDVGGLKEGDAVNLWGVRVGRVAALRLHEDRLLVTLEVDGVTVYRDAEVEVVSVNALGFVAVSLDPGHAAAGVLPPPPEGRLTGIVRTGLGLGEPYAGRDRDLSQGIADFAEVTRRLMDPGEGTAGRLLFDAHRALDVREGLAAFEQDVRALDEGLAAVEAGTDGGSLLAAEPRERLAATLEGLHGAAAGLEAGLASAERGEGTAGVLLAGDPTSTRELLSGLAASTDALAREEIALFPFAKPIHDTLQGSAGRLAPQAREAREGEGIFGLLSAPHATEPTREAIAGLAGGLGGLAAEPVVRHPAGARAFEDAAGDLHDTLRSFTAGLRRLVRTLRRGLPDRTYQGAVFAVF